MVLVATAERVPVELPASPIGLVIRAMEEVDLERFRTPEVLIPERRLADFAARLRSGRVAQIGLVDDRLCGYGWLSRQAEIDATYGVKISPGPDEGYVYDGFVFSSFRSKRLYAPLLHWRVDWLLKRGCQKVYAIVFADNTRSLNVCRQVGFGVCGEISFTEFLGFRFSRKYVTSARDIQNG
jgi:GNAT superfamily N-acetyltransferase